MQHLMTVLISEHSRLYQRDQPETETKIPSKAEHSPPGQRCKVEWLPRSKASLFSVQANKRVGVHSSVSSYFSLDKFHFTIIISCFINGSVLVVRLKRKSACMVKPVGLVLHPQETSGNYYWGYYFFLGECFRRTNREITK